MYKIAMDNLSALFQKIAESNELYLPIENCGQVNYGVWSEDADVNIEALKTVKSPKDAFFPQSENLYRCDKEEKKISITPAQLKDQSFVVFGMKACDIQGVEVLDKVFLSDPVATWIVDGELCWKALTEKGEALTDAVKDLLTDDSAADAKVEEKKAEIKDIVEKLPYMGLSLEGWGSEVVDEKFDERFNSPVWNDLYKPCLACGTCTFVCPTCQCYDIKDYDTGHGVERYRCWDSCMYSDFTMMAHGNNRNSQMQRFRQRFMHKLVYYPVNNDGMYSCVGCGRCVEKCPQSLNIVKVIKAFENQGGEK